MGWTRDQMAAHAAKELRLVGETCGGINKNSPHPFPNLGSFAVRTNRPVFLARCKSSAGTAMQLASIVCFVKVKPQTIGYAFSDQDQLFFGNAAAQPSNVTFTFADDFKAIKAVPRNDRNHVTLRPNLCQLEFRRQRLSQNYLNLKRQIMPRTLTAQGNNSYQVRVSARKLVGHNNNRAAFDHFGFFKTSKVAKQNLASLWKVYNPLLAVVANLYVRSNH